MKTTTKLIVTLPKTGGCLVLALAAMYAASMNPQAWAEPADVAAAVRAGSPFWAAYHLQRGADPNQRVDGLSYLAHVVREGNFAMARILIQAGARLDDISEEERDRMLRDGDADSESLAIQYLLRSYDLTRRLARPLPAGYQMHPERVIVFEPTVDYQNPLIIPHYHVNEIERLGTPGVDDDNNGFVDDVYGWSVATDRPHRLTRMQEDMWKQGRDVLIRLMALHDRQVLGELTDDSSEIQKLHQSFENPLSALWGTTGGYSDFDFLKNAVELSHGSHVAGIVIDHSEGLARLHTLSWDRFGYESARNFRTPEPLPGESFERLLARFKEENLDELVQRGQRASDFLRVTGAGVVNGSFGLNVGYWVEQARQILLAMAETDPNVERNFRDYLKVLAYEFYAYNTIPYAVAIAENPQILFVAAAGNDRSNNDETLSSPSYLSRFFPHVITIAACDENGARASFSNFGRSSVNLAAPGVAIESHGIAGTRLLMNGTSMAAPAVSGVAATLRAADPDLPAATIRTLLELGASRNDAWRNTVSSGGIMDKDATLGLMQRQPDALVRALWSVLSDPPDNRPEAWVWLRRELSQKARELPQHLDLNYVLAVALDVSGSSAQALGQIDRVIEQNSSQIRYWRSRVLILQNLSDHGEIVETVARFQRRYLQGDMSGTTTHVVDLLDWGIQAAEETGNRVAAREWRGLFREVTGTDYQDPGTGIQILEIEGALRAGMPRRADGEYMTAYVFTGDAGTAVSVDLFSTAFDTYLVVESPRGTAWENDDWNGSVDHSRVEIVLPESGGYLVVVTSYDAGETGPFRLRVEGVGVRDLRPFDPARDGGATDGVNRRTGRLGRGDPTLAGGEYFNRFTIELTRGDRIELNLYSTDFDTFLVLRSPQGMQWENDDWEGSVDHSRLAITASESGTYVILVTSYGPGETGAYELVWSVTGAGAGSRALRVPGTATVVESAESSEAVFKMSGDNKR